MTTLMNIATNPEIAGCLAPDLLIPILVGAGNSADSVVSPMDAWVTSLCASPACSTTVLTSLVNNVTAGCSEEYALPDVQITLNFVEKNYPTFRDVMCLKQGSTNCVTQTLTNLQNSIGTMDFSDANIAAITTDIRKGFPSSVLCTDCMHGTYTLINQYAPGTISAANKTYATTTCGASFVDGGIPPGLIQSAYNASATAAAPTSTTPASTTTPSVLPSASIPVPVGNAALGGPSAGPFLALAISGLVMVSTGMAFV